MVAESALTLASFVSMKTGRDVRYHKLARDFVPLGEEEKRAMKKAAADDGTDKKLGWRGRGAAEEIWNITCLRSIDGIKSGDVGELARNVIPATANAVLDIRLVKGNDYVRQVEKLKGHIRGQEFFITDREPTEAERLQHPLIVKFLRGGGYNAQRTPMNLRFRRAWSSSQATTNKPIVKMPTGAESFRFRLSRQFECSDNHRRLPITKQQHAENEYPSQNIWDGSRYSLS